MLVDLLNITILTILPVSQAFCVLFNRRLKIEISYISFTSQKTELTKEIEGVQLKLSYVSNRGEIRF